MTYAQLTGRQSLRDIEANLRAELPNWTLESQPTNTSN
jgi:hypothetical protein